MNKYSVYPIEENLSTFESQLNTLRTFDKKEALNYAKNLLNNYKEVSFNCDFYKNGECVKNEFGYYLASGEIKVYSIIDYSIKKEKKPIKINHFDFWDEDVLSKIN